MSPWRTPLLTVLAMIAFAANSLLCRLALKETSIDAATFTTLRLLAGAVALYLLVGRRRTSGPAQGGWISAVSLFVYAITFSFAYVSLSVATGALLAFGAVQAGMIFWGLRSGERLNLLQTAGLLLAIGGLVYLVLPGLESPPLLGSLLMFAAGIAWAVYSLRGRGVTEPAAATAANFLRATPLAVAVSVAALPWAHFDTRGALYAMLSGAVASGMGYIVWYSALPGLTATRASIVQLSVPVIAALSGVILLDEAVSLHLILSSLTILGGIALVVGTRKRT
jgi:drug/metabolite transporter (DMT)-like permease